MFPAPRRVELGEGSGSTRVRSTQVDHRLPPQGYVLEVTADGTDIRHADEAGLRYARATLGQLELSSPVPAQRIVDHPDHLRRGFMLDISRDRVPTNEHLAWLVEVLAQLRYNHLELYMEHTFRYAGHDEVWRDASPLGADDVRSLDDLCARHGIELVANQNTFGHMERWLRHASYRHRAECPDGAVSPFTGRPMAPATLAPTPANAGFAVDLVRELAACFASATVNIGADEPFELGQGHSAEDVARRGRAAVYLDHLNRLVEPLAAEGREVLFWGDVLRRHPDLVARLPQDGAAAVVWDYEAPAATLPVADQIQLPADLLEVMGMPDDHHLGFEAHTRSFVETGYPFWVAGGTSTWNTLIGRWDNARANLLDAATTGRDKGALGFLVTDWGDNGHLQPPVVSLLPLAYGGGVGWCADTNADAGPALAAVDAISGTAGLGSLLADLGDAHRLSGVRTFNGSPLFGAMDPTRPLPLIGHGTIEGLTATLDLLGDGLARATGLGASAHAEGLRAAIRLARQGAWALAERSGHGALVPGAAEQGADRAECLDLQRAAWLLTSRPGGLADSLTHVSSAASPPP